jgi:hypothetical protein
MIDLFYLKTNQAKISTLGWSKYCTVDKNTKTIFLTVRSCTSWYMCVWSRDQKRGRKTKLAIGCNYFYIIFGFYEFQFLQCKSSCIIVHNFNIRNIKM